MAGLALVAIAACGSDPTTSPHASPAPAVSIAVGPPPGRGPVTEAGIDVVAADAVHPEVLRTALGEAGFLGGAERAATGGDAFARVVTRRLRFTDEAGAQGFVDWIATNAGTEFFAVERLPAAEDVLLLRHVPDGCCPREVRIYLAAWTSGDEVVTVKAQGPRSSDRAMTDLVDELRTDGGS